MNILANPSDNYRRWADGKLEGFTDKIDDLLVEINNPLSISTAEKSQIDQIIKSKNVVFFDVNKPIPDKKKQIKTYASIFGMGDYELDSKSDTDGLTEIKHNKKTQQDIEYIPYSDKQLNWHTDGYYNSQSNSILSWLLYCVCPSDDGGINKYMDHEIAYILYNKNYQNITKLMIPDSYIIPENKSNSRPEVKNPVFSFVNNRLNMKFSMREKNIIWNEKITDEINNLKNIIKSSHDYHLTYKLQAGQGVVTNNVIHMRTAFTNSKNKNRLLYRLRSKIRVSC